jgi:hypothetical protein
MAAEEEVTDRSADEERAALLLRSDLFDEVEGAALRVR